MTAKNRTKIRFLARIMSLVVVLQCIFVVLDAAGAAYGTDKTDYHHETLSSDDQPEFKGTEKAKGLDAIQTADSGDHCCYFHGHCSHFTALDDSNTLMDDTSSSRPLSDEPNPFSTYIQSTHRPPIV